jgi:hypothetical protein
MKYNALGGDLSELLDAEWVSLESEDDSSKAASNSSYEGLDSSDMPYGESLTKKFSYFF